MSKNLEMILRKMKVGDLKKEISKQNIRGYSKMKKEEIINLMLDNKKRFKYLLLQNLNQKKELLEDKVKLKKAKQKLEKLTAKKISSKKPQKAEVIPAKPKREPMIPKVIESKPITIKKGGKFITVKKELKDIDLLDLKLKNLENKLLTTKSPVDAKDSKELQKRAEIREQLSSQIRKVKVQIFDIKQKNKQKDEKDKIKKEKDELKEFRSKIEEFIGNPSDELLEEIDQKFELLEDLPQFLQDNFDNAMEEYEKKDKKPEPKKPAPKKEPAPKPEPKKEEPEKPAPKRLKKDIQDDKYREEILEANKKSKLFNRKRLKKQLDGRDSIAMSYVIKSRIEDEIDLFSKTDIISDNDIDVFKKGSGKIKNRMYHIINDLQKLIFNKKTTKPAVDFINFLNNETNKREKLYIGVKIQQSFDEYCLKLKQLEEFIKIVRPLYEKTYLERIKFLDERCLDLIEIIDDLKDKFNITTKQIWDNELMIF